MIRLLQAAPQDTALRNTALSDLLQPDLFAPRLIQIFVIFLFAFIGYRVVKILIRRLVSREIEEDDPIIKRTREQRARTLGSLLQNAALIVIVIVTSLTILGSFVEIGPLLASVGVLGLAVSFGAQSLVKDIITGAFLLVEGQFAIGDVVRIGDVSGMVERITLRTVILRDLQGAVHIIPNGEITRVSNLTRTWSRAVIDVSVDYKEDADRVVAVLMDIGRSLHEDPEWGPLLVERPEVPGIEEFADAGMIVRMLAKTLPLQQWNVARELRRRIKKRFDAEQIVIPYPHVTFYWGEGQMPPGPAMDRAFLGDSEPETTRHG
jgi:small conductance mechanosensitive channel